MCVSMITHNLLCTRYCSQKSMAVQSQNNGQSSEPVLIQGYALFSNPFLLEVQADRAMPVASSPDIHQVPFPSARSCTPLTRRYRNSIAFNKPMPTHLDTLCHAMEKALMI